MCVLCWGNDVTVCGGVLSSECSPPMCVLCWGNDVTVGGVLSSECSPPMCVLCWGNDVTVCVGGCCPQSVVRLCVCFAGVMM